MRDAAATRPSAYTQHGRVYALGHALSVTDAVNHTASAVESLQSSFNVFFGAMISKFESHQPNIHAQAFVHEMAFVSGQTTIGADSSIWPMAVLRGDVNTIVIGERSNVQDGAVLHTSHDGDYSKPGGEPLTIGDDVTVGHNATIHGCTLEDRCLIGMGAVVLDGAVVQSDNIIAAGALVPPGKVLESGFLWVGSPVKPARPLSEKEITFLRYSAQHYVKLSQRTQSA